MGQINECVNTALLTEDKQSGGKAPKKNGFTERKRKKALFLISFLAFPVIQFCIFYIGVNINTVVLSFQEYDIDAGKYTFAGFTNYATVIRDIFVNGTLTIAIRNSTIQFFVNLIIALPLHVFVAYCVWKKLPFSEVFKVILFLPSMVSGTVFVMIVRYLLDYGVPALFDVPTPLNAMTFDGFKTILIYDLWIGFAGGMVVYLGAMSNISEDVVEYGKLENLNTFQEFIYLVVPSIFPTITTYLVASIAGFFTNYGSAYTFFGGSASSNAFHTLGYHFFVKVAGIGSGSDLSSQANYPYAAAGGFLFTVVVAPITLLVKWLLEKYGPSDE